MGYIIRGRLCGYICRDCREDLSNILVRIYRPQKGEENTGVVVADPKYTLRVLDDKTVSAKKGLLLGEGKTDEKGNYSIELGDEFDGGLVVIDVQVTKVPNQTSDVKKTVQFTITTMQPQWRQREDAIYFDWDYCISYTFWCAIRALFDAWVICGFILDCKNDNRPLVGVKVSAFDADCIKDDFLGSAITNAAGHFRIDYTSKDFKQTFLSPLINLETPFSSNPGPDVYFVVETGGGTVIYEEKRADGKQNGRRDIPNCYCIKLCVPIDNIGTNPGTPLASAWTGIGTAFTIPFGADLNDFDAEGYAGSLKYACFGNIRTTGQVAISSNNKALQGNPYEYRFLVSDNVVGVNGTPPLNASNFNKVVGDLANKNLFSPTKVGQMWYTGTPFKVVDVFAELADLDDDGWLDVNKSVERTFNNDATLNIADLNNLVEGPKWHWIDLDGMMAINTGFLTDNNMPAIANPGDAIPAAQRKGIEKIAIRFELREVIDKATNNFNYLPGSGQTLNAMVVNNTSPSMAFEIKQHLTGSSCDSLNGDIDVSYTAQHPELEDVRINIRSNDGAINQNLTGPGMPINNNINPAVNHVNNASLSITKAPNNIALKTCSYIATFSFKRRLHNGDGGVGTNQILKSFYYQV